MLYDLHMTVAEAERYARARGCSAYIDCNGRHCYMLPGGSVVGSTAVNFDTPIPTVARASVLWIFEGDWLTTVRVSPYITWQGPASRAAEAGRF